MRILSGTPAHARERIKILVSAVRFRPSNQNSKSTALGWLCRFCAIPPPRGIPGGSACATASVGRDKLGRLRPVSIPFCSLSVGVRLTHVDRRRRT